MKKICIVCGKEFETLDKRKTKCSKECINKYLSQKKKENWQDLKYKQLQLEKIRAGQSTLIAKYKMSIKKKGKPSWNKGRVITQEQKEKQSKSMVGHIPWNKDKTEIYSQETKEKMSKQVRKSMTNNVRKRMSITAQNRIMSENTKNKISQALLNRTNEEIKKFVQKVNQTKSKNHTFNTSKPEEIIFNLLVDRFGINVKRQYMTKTYPFACDFYILELDLYIEYQGTWTHGCEPFDSTNKNHLEKLKRWQDKGSKFYSKAIKVWTESDPLKRRIAKSNNLNWIEFFTMNQFLVWYDKQRV